MSEPSKSLNARCIQCERTDIELEEIVESKRYGQSDEDLYVTREKISVSCEHCELVTGTIILKIDNGTEIDRQYRGRLKRDRGLSEKPAGDKTAGDRIRERIRDGERW